jgi:hypothetical protein
MALPSPAYMGFNRPGLSKFLPPPQRVHTEAVQEGMISANKKNTTQNRQNRGLFSGLFKESGETPNYEGSTLENLHQS